MAIPAYLWLKDDGGADIKGAVDVRDREGSIEILQMMHSVELPVDGTTGKITGTRVHSGYAFEKETDSASPYLYSALTTGRRFQSAEFKFYKINDNGMEVEYFNTKLEGVRVSSIEPLMHDIKCQNFSRHTHHEFVELRYEKITWHYLDGNIIHSDSWDAQA